RDVVDEVGVALVAARQLARALVEDRRDAHVIRPPRAGSTVTGMSSRGDNSPRADTDETVEEGHQELVERLRRLRWPRSEPGQAERAFERLMASLGPSDD